MEISTKTSTMGANIRARWTASVRRDRLFHAGERVGVAVSGGADSMLLLDFMFELAREAGLRLAVVHFNHRLRGAESDADQSLVSERAGQLGLEFLCSGADVARAAREKKKNLEATAREMRYRFFFSLVLMGKLDKVATAHTANDQAETVLLRLLRGAGTRGLGGIHPRLEGGVVRPFLGLTRAEVEAEVARRGLKFRMDSTNQDERFHRNRIRRQVLPMLERDFNPGLVRSLAAFAERARDDESVLEEQARERARAWLGREGGKLKIPTQRLGEFPPAIARRVLRQMLAEAANAGGKNRAILAYAEVESLRRLARESQSGKALQLPAGLEARKEFEWLVIGPGQTVPRAGTARAGFIYLIDPPAEFAIPELGLRLHFRLAEEPGSQERAYIEERAYTIEGGVWLDAARLARPLTLRSWRPGDFLGFGRGAKRVKLKEFFQRLRVPRNQRAYWPVLEAASEIVWAWRFERWVDATGAAETAGKVPPPQSRRLVITGEKV